MFGRPRWEYQSYTDLWTMIDLSGFSWVWIDEIDPQDQETTYIITGPDVNIEWEDPTATIIFWLLEWYGDYYQRPGVADTWVSNRTFAEMTGAKYVPMGSHAGLGTTEKLPIEYDFIHLSYADIHRRRRLLDRCLEHGLTIAPNAWGEERDKNMRSSRALVHIHQSEDYPAIAPLRASIGAAYGLPLIAESGWSAAPYDEVAYIREYEALPDELPKILAREDWKLRSKGAALYHLLCHELRFDKVVLANV